MRQTRTNPPRNYLDLVLNDGEETIVGKDWDYKTSTPVPKAGLVYDITGIVGEFAGKKQLSPVTYKVSDNQDMSEMQCNYCTDLENVREGLYQRIEHIGNEKLRNITKYIYDKHIEEILRATSAKSIHHVGIGGNACHSIDVYDHGASLARYYAPRVSVDLVKAGALLHDIGKLFAYGIDGALIVNTMSGNLFDHIVLGIRVLDEARMNGGLMIPIQVRLIYLSIL